MRYHSPFPLMAIVPEARFSKKHLLIDHPANNEIKCGPLAAPSETRMITTS